MTSANKVQASDAIDDARLISGSETTRPPSSRRLVAHFSSLGCRVVSDDEDFSVPVVCHLEDARDDTLSWHRRGPGIHSFPGVLIAMDDDTRIDARIVARHADPRRIVRSTLEKFYLDDYVVAIVHGDRCNIHPSSSIGAKGQNYAWEEGRWTPFPQVGGVRIGDDVDVGPCATIMRGCVGDTVIGNGSKIGNGVNVGHDTRIGENTIIVSGSSIAGWARIGSFVRIWQGAQVKNGVRIGDGAQIAMGAVILDDVPGGEVWGGNPGRRLR